MSESYDSSAKMMESGNISNESDVTIGDAPTSCAEFKQMLISGRQPYELLIFLNPVNNTLWTDRDIGWSSVFKVYIGIFGTIYLLLGLISLILLIKKDCVRLPTKTFFAVYTTIAILGFSRSLQLILDPYDLLGFISSRFTPWIIMTRLLGSLGFPSLVASYTLMVFTLIKIAKAKPGKQWYHRWRYVVPIVVLPYVIAVLAEVIGYLAEYPGLLSVIVCEVTFALWGVTVCITYLFAGGRLMHQLRRRERNTVKMSSSTGPTQAEGQANHMKFAAEEYERHHRHNRKTARKIAIITYGTVVVAFLYSLLTFGNIIMVSLFLFKECLGFTGMRGDSNAWLGLHISTRATEITLAVIMLYSITDISGVVKFASRMFMGMCCCSKRMRVTECSRQGHHPPPNLATMTEMHDNTSSQTNILSHSHDEVVISRDDAVNTPPTSTTAITEPTFAADTRGVGTVVDVVSNYGDSGIQLEAMTGEQINYPSSISSVSLNNGPRTFLLNASKGESSSSIESSALPTTMSQEYTQAQQASPSKQHSTPLTAAIKTNTLTETSEEYTNILQDEEQHDVIESQTQNKHLKPEELILIDIRSPVHTLTLERDIVHTSTVDNDTDTCVVEMTDESDDEQTKTPPDDRSKPVAKPRRLAPKSPRERRQKMREQSQNYSENSLSSKLKRQQTV